LSRRLPRTRFEVVDCLFAYFHMFYACTKRATVLGTACRQAGTSALEMFIGLASHHDRGNEWVIYI
jgi:hypothetical protein